MGIYDRDYYRQERPGFSLGAPESAIVTIILVNVAVYLIDGLFSQHGRFSFETHPVGWTLSLHDDTLTKPWLWWQFVTYGFVHDPSPGHIIGNMLGLWFLGREVEDLYGRGVHAVVSRANHFRRDRLGGGQRGPRSGGWPGDGGPGAVVGVVLLFALNFPRRTILFMFVIPMPAWILG